MISIIIPTYNEEKNIKKLLEYLDDLTEDFEVIFSDGGSSDNTLNLIDKYTKIQETKYRANQMNAAVKYAKGDYLWFIHADSKIDRLSLKYIENSEADAGCFRLKFDSDNSIMKIVAFFSNLRVVFRNIAFGDQGIFIKKDLFLKLGGFESIPLMEDYQLSIKLKKKKIKIKLIDDYIITSDRKFRNEGILKTIIKMQILQYKFRKQEDIFKIYREYYGDSND